MFKQSLLYFKKLFRWCYRVGKWAYDQGQADGGKVFAFVAVVHGLKKASNKR